MLSSRLASLIVNLGMKSVDFAARIGFSQAYVSLIMNGKKTNPSQRFFDSVAREFNVSVQWLREGTGDMFTFPDLDISSSDATLLAKYRLLPAAERKIVDDIVDAILLKTMTTMEDRP